MDKKKALNIRLLCTGIVTLLMWGYLAWDYFHEGVSTHYLYIFENLPGISNWWGGIVLPLLTWFLLTRIQYRMNGKDESGIKNNLRYVIYGFLGSLIFGILFPYFYFNGYFQCGTNIPEYVMLTLIVTSFFIPLYRAEYFLGLVIGMTYALGPILPIGIGVILVVLFGVTYKYIRTGILYITSVIRD